MAAQIHHPNSLLFVTDLTTAPRKGALLALVWSLLHQCTPPYLVDEYDKTYLFLCSIRARLFSLQTAQASSSSLENRASELYLVKGCPLRSCVHLLLNSYRPLFDEAAILLCVFFCRSLARCASQTPSRGSLSPECYSDVDTRRARPAYRSG